MKRIYLSLAICFCIELGSIAQTGLNAFVNAANFKRANLSLMVKDLSSDKIIVQHRANKNTIPASTTKIVTTATALEVLGPDFTFETKLQYDGLLNNGVLNGNIYILGGGDPTLGSAYIGDSLFLEKWIEAIKATGIKKIIGAVVADASLYNNEGIAPKWSWEDMGNYYAAGVYGISIYDNTCRVYFKSGAIGSTPTIVRTQPVIPGLNFNLFLKAANTNDDNAYFYGAPFSNERSVYGTIPANKNEFVSKADIPNPPLYAAQVLTQKLKESGIEISLQASNVITSMKMRTTIHTLKSPSLREIISIINHKSNNHYSEQLFRYLSLQQSKVANTNDAIQFVNDFWKKQDIDNNGLIMFDGCGLSPNNAISAEFLVNILSYEQQKGKYKDDFIASLPVAGESGTIKNLLKGTKLAGKVKAKSGSIHGVQCFAGYIEWNNKTYAFAVLVNNYTGTRSNTVKEIEKLLLSVTK